MEQITQDRFIEEMIRQQHESYREAILCQREWLRILQARKPVAPGEPVVVEGKK